MQKFDLYIDGVFSKQVDAQFMQNFINDSCCGNQKINIVLQKNNQEIEEQVSPSSIQEIIERFHRKGLAYMIVKIQYAKGLFEYKWKFDPSLNRIECSNLRTVYCF